jgi:hypothetical protein
MVLCVIDLTTLYFIISRSYKHPNFSECSSSQGNVLHRASLLIWFLAENHILFHFKKVMKKVMIAVLSFLLLAFVSVLVEGRDFVSNTTQSQNDKVKIKKEDHRLPKVHSEEMPLKGGMLRTFTNSTVETSKLS